jgi:uncharacterized glyoxalase superfamily protein PhnB
MKLTSYLVFNGQAEEAANFYADVLGGKIDNLYRYESMPPTPEMPVPEGRWPWPTRCRTISATSVTGDICLRWHATPPPSPKRCMPNSLSGHRR